MAVGVPNPFVAQTERPINGSLTPFVALLEILALRDGVDDLPTARCAIHLAGFSLCLCLGLDTPIDPALLRGLLLATGLRFRLTLLAGRLRLGLALRPPFNLLLTGVRLRGPGLGRLLRAA